MPLQATSGAASYDGFGGGVAVVPNYIEECFATHLYTGTGVSQTITNGIDLSTKGGMVWAKVRSGPNLWDHTLFDTSRGVGYWLSSNTTAAQDNGGGTGALTAFNSNGFSLGTYAVTNQSGTTYASWTFRKQPKFFDVVTYTGDGTSGRTLAHSLGSVPGCVIIKRTSTTGDWVVWHRSLGGTYPSSREYLRLNLTSAADTASQPFTAAPSSSALTLSASVASNASGSTYVAYLFAHDAGGFGLTGTDNVISCGSFTTDGSGDATVTLGYEPQWTLIKRSDSSTGGNWRINDNMRNMVAAPNLGDQLFPNLSSAESIGNGVAQPTATGFTTNNGALNASATYIYIAIRRGPMKTPTTGTSVFTTNTYTGTGAARTITTGFVTDLVIGQRLDGLSGHAVGDRLRGDTLYLQTNTTGAEATSDGSSQDITGFDFMTGYGLGVPNNSWMNNSGSSCANWNFRRAPGFFDVVCYTGTGSATTQAHNLGVVPELMIVKRRNAGGEFDWWPVYSKAPFNSPSVYQLNTTSGAFNMTSVWNSTNPTASVFSVGTSQTTNASGGTYVAYLFASCPGVSKCGSYTGTGALQTIDCGFTGGARFVLIKRYDNSGDWWLYDSARGISSGNDPYLFLNSTAAEVTGTNYVDTDSTGFKVTAAAPAGLNANGGSYIFLAIA